MKFALLGIDDDTKVLARAILSSDSHSLVAFCTDDDVATSRRVLDELAETEPDFAAALTGLAPFESSASVAEADAVIVSRSSQTTARLEQARSLARQGVSLVISHPLSLSPLDYYELEMVSREGGGVLVPLLPEQETQPIRRFFAMANSTVQQEPAASESESTSPIEQVVVHRHLPDRSREVVLEYFARDARLLSEMCGEIKSVAAMGPEVTAAKYTNLNVQMTGTAGRLAHWSVEPTSDSPHATISVVTSKQTIKLDMTDYEDRAQWSLAGLGDEGVDVAADETDLADVIAARLATPANAEAAQTSWQDATRSIELTETVTRSLKKGRTIKLHAEGRGEEDAFKGTMATLGCGILIGIMFLLFGLAAAFYIARVSGIKWVNNIASWLGYWPYALLAVLVAFLLIQFLWFVIPSKGGGRSADGSSSGDHTASNQDR